MCYYMSVITFFKRVIFCARQMNKMFGFNRQTPTITLHIERYYTFYLKTVISPE